MRQLTEDELAEAREAARHMESTLRKYPWTHPLLSPEEKRQLMEERKEPSSAQPSDGAPSPNPLPSPSSPEDAMARMSPDDAVKRIKYDEGLED